MSTSIRRKKRTNITQEQCDELLRIFEIDPFPSAKQRQRLSEYLNISSRSVQVWFQNRRQKVKALISHENEIRERVKSALLGTQTPPPAAAQPLAPACRRLYILADLADLAFQRRYRKKGEPLPQGSKMYRTEV